MPSVFDKVKDNDTLVDDYDQLSDDRTDVVVVSPSGSGSDVEPETLLANDCMLLRFRIPI